MAIDDISPIAKIKNKKRTFGQLFFLKIRKALSAATTPKVAPAWLNLNSSRFNRLVVLLDAGGGAELFRGAVPGYNSGRGLLLEHHLWVRRTERCKLIAGHYSTDSQSFLA